MPSVFDIPLFTQLLVKFPVQCCDAKVDERGNLSTMGGVIVVKFKLNKPTNTDTQDWQGAQSSQRVIAYCLDPLELPKEINIGHVGEAAMYNRQLEVKVKNIVFSSVAPVVDSILGQKVLLEIIERSQYGTGTS